MFMKMPFTPAEVFYSYTETDGSLLSQLEKHLSVLQRAGLINPWHKLHITAGTNWKEELDHHFETASIILLLISADFFHSDYQYVELQRAMERHEANEARVIPILLRPCIWEYAPFANLQVLPRNHVPITSWRNRDAAFTQVAREIEATLKKLQQLTIAAPSTHFPKIWQIPYPRNPMFTGREDLLKELQDLLLTKKTATQAQPQTQAVSGLGGVGKTQLAVEYAFRNASRYQIVLWVNAETPETLIADYTRLARDLKLPLKNEHDQQVVIETIKWWLKNHQAWLLILDNVDDLKSIQSLLPPIHGGHVLLTTRNQVSGRLAHHLDVSVLPNEEGALLLLRRAGILSKPQTLEEATTVLARQISQELGDLPLALDQAGAYIEETGCSLQSYQQQYQALE